MCDANSRIPTGHMSQFSRFDCLIDIPALFCILALDVDFAYEPQGGMFSLGDTAEFPCQPPSGNPTPEVTFTYFCLILHINGCKICGCEI